MSHQALRRGIAALAAVTLALPLMSTAASAQTIGGKFDQAQPELADLFDAAYLAQARMFEEIADIDRSRATRAARNQFETSLRMHANLSMAEMMAMMRTMNMRTMPGPFDELESTVSRELIELLGARHSSAALLGAYEESALSDRAVELIRLGRLFEVQVYDIFADVAIRDKKAALDEALASYLAAELSVPAQPKPASLLFDHAQAGAFVAGYPKLSTVLWSAQWLQLATLEAMILEQQDAYYWGSVDTVRERFASKITDSARSRSPLPVELPMAPAIAPSLFSLSPEAAIVLDNLNVFETVVADILTYPNLANKTAAMDAMVDAFTDHAEDLASTIDYLYSALRGGIYNQGGPAIGELAQSERNRSRMEMGMRHSMIMSVP